MTRARTDSSARPADNSSSNKREGRSKKRRQIKAAAHLVLSAIHQQKMFRGSLQWRVKKVDRRLSSHGATAAAAPTYRTTPAPMPTPKHPCHPCATTPSLPTSATTAHAAAHTAAAHPASMLKQNTAPQPMLLPPSLRGHPHRSC
jgi:hypothetical protein